MKWVDKLERRFGRIAIHDLMMAIVIGQAVVFLAEFFMPGLGIWSKLSLYMPAVLQGEVWRLITFIFVPSASTPISLLLTLYLMWLIGHTLEQSWGDFRFNVYYLLGVLGAILAAVITRLGHHLLSESVFVLCLCHAVPGNASAFVFHHSGKDKVAGPVCRCPVPVQPGVRRLGRTPERAVLAFEFSFVFRGRFLAHG